MLLIHPDKYAAWLHLIPSTSRKTKPNPLSFLPSVLLTSSRAASCCCHHGFLHAGILLGPDQAVRYEPCAQVYLAFQELDVPIAHIKHWSCGSFSSQRIQTAVEAQRVAGLLCTGIWVYFLYPLSVRKEE